MGTGTRTLMSPRASLDWVPSLALSSIGIYLVHARLSDPLPYHFVPNATHEPRTIHPRYSACCSLPYPVFS